MLLAVGGLMRLAANEEAVVREGRILSRMATVPRKETTGVDMDPMVVTTRSTRICVARRDIEVVVAGNEAVVV